MFLYNKTSKKGRLNKTLAHFIEEWCKVWNIKCRLPVVKGGHNKSLNFLCPHYSLRNTETIKVTLETLAIEYKH